MTLRAEHDAEEEQHGRSSYSDMIYADDDTGSSNMVEDMSNFNGDLDLYEDPVGDGAGGRTESEQVTLIRALRSLEKAINTHCVLLNKKLKKEKSANQQESRPGSKLGRIVTPLTAIRKEKVHVYIRVVFLKIGEIDTMKENFMADAFIQARWREQLLDNQQDLVLEDIEWEKFWNPKIYVENNLGEPKETIWQTAVWNRKAECTVYERRRIRGCFLENLELDDFPFDTQDLTLTVTSERSESEVDLDEDSSEISSINVQSFVDEQEWKLHSHVETWKRMTTRIYHNSKFKHPAVSTSCRASRRPGFFMWNIFLVMLFICSLAFVTFTVDLEKPQNRLQLSFILLLTTITFKFVVSQTLPRISYLTYLDKYILTSMGILCTVCIWHSVIPLLKYDKDLAITADRAALALLGGTYIVFHIGFFLHIYIVALKRRWQYTEKDREHKVGGIDNISMFVPISPRNE